MGRAAENKVMATFWVDREKREAFKELAKSQEDTASGLLLDFVDRCLSGELPQAGGGTNIEDLIKNLESRLESRIEQLEGKFTASI